MKAWTCRERQDTTDMVREEDISVKPLSFNGLCLSSLLTMSSRSPGDRKEETARNPREMRAVNRGL